MLHRSFIPNDKLCTLENLMEVVVPFDITGRGIVNGNRDLEM
jgi:hypothetical protein